LLGARVLELRPTPFQTKDAAALHARPGAEGTVAERMCGGVARRRRRRALRTQTSKLIAAAQDGYWITNNSSALFRRPARYLHSEDGGLALNLSLIPASSRLRHFCLYPRS